MNIKHTSRSRSQRLAILLVPIVVLLLLIAGFWKNYPAEAAETSAEKNKNGSNDAITRNEPTLAVRTSACITCHAKIHSSVITDFGYGDDYFFGKQIEGSKFGTFNGNIYGDFYGAEPKKTAWLTAAINGKIIVPKARLDLDLSKAAGKELASQSAYKQALQASSLAGYLQELEKQKPTPSTVVEAQNVYIGAPDAATLEARFNIPPGSSVGFRFIKSNNRTSPDLEGIELNPDKNYYTNIKKVVCDGDLLVRGALFLNRLNVATHNGCRIYATGPIFIQKAITQEGLGKATDNPNLQVVSAEAIMLGIADKSCDPAEKDKPLARRLISGYAVSTFMTRQAHRKSITPQKAGQAIYDKAQLITALEDASCHDEMIGFSGLLLNAPQIHCRYKGKFKGLVIAEVVLFRLGQADFEFDPVFKKVPILPLLKSTDYLAVK